MKITSKGRYGLRAMVDLAVNSETEPVSIHSIGERQDISDGYLEQLIAKLKRAGLVESIRGAAGGYRLARPTDKITAGEIVSAVEGKVDATQCRGGASCRGGAECLAHGLWSELNDRMAEFLNTQTLSDIRDRYEARHAHAAEAANESPVRVRMPAH